MKMERIEKIFQNKYSLLLTSLVLMMIASPIVTGYPLIAFFSESFLFVVIIAITLWISKAHKVFFSITISFAVAAMLFHYSVRFILNNKYLGLITLFTYTLYIGIAIIFMLKKIFSEEKVTADTVKGGISVYLLIGIWWQVLYTIIWVFDPFSFALRVNSINSPDFFYFSITTLTTLGYGDIIAKSHVAKTAAMIEAVTGQMYVAILISRLVSLHIVHSQKNK
jgi:hypothetical protein